MLQLDHSPDAIRPVIVATDYSIGTLAFKEEFSAPNRTPCTPDAARHAVVSIGREGTGHTWPARRSACVSRVTGAGRLADVTRVRHSSRTWAQRQAERRDKRDRNPSAENVGDRLVAER